MDVALITCSERPDLSHSDTLLLRALVARGIDTRPLVWNDPTVDWSRPVVSVIRSTWDYHYQCAAFLEWAQHVSQLHALWNPFPLVRWNTHKSYLRYLEERGVPIIPTHWLMRGAPSDLARLMQEHNWSEVVIKPAVSAEGYGTILITEEMVAEGQLYLDHMLSTHDMLIQPFFSTVMSSGERSLVFIDGEVTHAVVRPPIRAVSRTSSPADDPSAQMLPDLPQKALIVPQEEELRLAHQIIETLPSSVLYARIDLVHDAVGQPRVMEIELVEPELWLAWVPEAVERFADAIARKVKQARYERESVSGTSRDAM